MLLPLIIVGLILSFMGGVACGAIASDGDPLPEGWYLLPSVAIGALLMLALLWVLV
ncbi:hypothetical protein [Paracoccus sp. (in: a-proteobacteria)]|uniref:hypothetical protein n=1 Tax=Paracoccus sp. TaxID=267 RepID=UPI0026DF648C|nr:hypothetical protein [Paracoccus sp. (in: a-proteobacteria)]MDO5648369.1 hypothetical protein [Paracoccus sp. (in: a-proteobacteria)]